MPKSGRKPVPWEERFVQYVSSDGSGCLLWTGARNDGGYGVLKADGRMEYAHRLSLRLRGVELVPEDVVDHLCRVRHCVNADHLRVVDDRANILAGIGPTAVNARKRVCGSGHALTGGNVYEHQGKRHCRSCRRDRKRLARSNKNNQET